MPKIYRTRQYEDIVRCLQSRASHHLTAAQVTDLLHSEGNAIGAATVYRHLERLVQEGAARKYVTGQGAPACYQYAGDAPCGEHYHLRCVICGKLIHLDCEVLRDISDHIRQHHNFEIDATKTVFYGRCADCIQGGSDSSDRAEPTKKESSCHHDCHNC